MKKLSVFAILFLLFKTISFAEIREPQKMERITFEVTRTSNVEINFVDQTRKDEENKSWIKRHPVLGGMLIGVGAGFTIGVIGGQSILYDTNRFGNGLYMAGIGAGVGALVGKVASEY